MLIFIKHGLNTRGIKMRANALNKIIDNFSRLPLNDKEYLAEILEKQLIEAKREAIEKRAKRAVANSKKGKIKRGTFKELYKDLELD
jgi:hypothetical protein